MGWSKVYILIMGSIRSFDGRNCEWLIKYTRAVSGAHGAHSGMPNPDPALPDSDPALPDPDPALKI